MSAFKSQEILEKGDIQFYYRSACQKNDSPSRQPLKKYPTKNIQRFYIVLCPDYKKNCRVIVVGRKRFPAPVLNDKHWATVVSVSEHKLEHLDTIDSEFMLNNLKKNNGLGEIKPDGKGKYAIVYSENQTYLVYCLVTKLEEAIEDKALDLKIEGSYLLAIKNQRMAKIRNKKGAEFPEYLQNKFKGLRFISVNPPHFLNYPGAELLLVDDKHHFKEALAINKSMKPKSFNENEICAEIDDTKNVAVN